MHSPLLRLALVLCIMICTRDLAAQTEIGFERELPDPQLWGYRGADSVVIIENEEGPVLDFRDESATEPVQLAYLLAPDESHDMATKGFKFVARIQPGDIDDATHNNLSFRFTLPDLKPVEVRLTQLPQSGFIAVSSYDYVREKFQRGRADSSGFIEIVGTYRPDETHAGGGIFTVEADGVHCYDIPLKPDLGSTTANFAISSNFSNPERNSCWLIESVKIAIP